mgnify:CR=1 FL=1
MWIQTLTCAAALSVTMIGSAMADSSAPAVLNVGGALTGANAGQTVAYDLDMLRAMPVVEIKTETIWTEGENTFTGVSMHSLMDELGVTAGTLEMIALNDYAVEMPLTDAVPGGAVLVYEMNGEEMSVRDKGPLWVLYPFDSNPEFQAEEYYSRSIWQLDRINVKGEG